MSKTDPIPGKLGSYRVDFTMMSGHLRSSTVVEAISRAAAVASVVNSTGAEVLRYASEAEQAEAHAAYAHRQATWAAVAEAARAHGVDAVREGYAHDPQLLRDVLSILRDKCTRFPRCEALVHHAGCSQVYYDEHPAQAAAAGYPSKGAVTA